MQIRNLISVACIHAIASRQTEAIEPRPAFIFRSSYFRFARGSAKNDDENCEERVYRQKRKGRRKMDLPLLPHGLDVT